MTSKIPYEGAAENECGRQYRPGQVPPETNYCRLIKDHLSLRHSSRRHMGDDAGFEWFDAEESELVWPEQVEEGVMTKPLSADAANTLHHVTSTVVSHEQAVEFDEQDDYDWEDE